MKRKNFPMYILITVALLVLSSLMLAGCTNAGNNANTAATETTMAEMTTAAAAGETTAAATGSNTADSTQVICKNNKFIPDTLTVKVGTTVTWINQDGNMHTVTSGTSPNDRSGLFDSGNINGGGTFSFKFDKAGTYDYFCIPHFSLGMIGKIIVTG
jgi:plastocyanin